MSLFIILVISYFSFSIYNDNIFRHTLVKLQYYNVYQCRLMIFYFSLFKHLAYFDRSVYHLGYSLFYSFQQHHITWYIEIDSVTGEVDECVQQMDTVIILNVGQREGINIQQRIKLFCNSICHFIHYYYFGIIWKLVVFLCLCYS